MRLPAVAIALALAAPSRCHRLTMTSSSQPAPSGRISATDEPCIVAMQRMLASGGAEKPLSLAQGIVYWTPPAGALDAAAAVVSDAKTSAYGADDGLPELRQRLREKLSAENAITGAEVMVTAGANQAYMNVVLALVEPGDRVGLVAPYYFNHLMALQMTGLAPDLVYCPADEETMVPDLEFLETAIPTMKMLTLCSPCNPTGVVYPEAFLRRVSELCAQAGCWLVVDNTYEYFTFDGHQHSTVSGSHVVNIFSFSKAFGMMGWRIGYLAYPPNLESSLMKVQDTIPICPPIISQRLALEAMSFGREWVHSHFDVLEQNRRAVLSALEEGLQIGETPDNGARIFGGQGAIYLLAKLPAHFEDDKVLVERLAKEEGIVVIPGSSCGAPGHIRVAFANLKPEDCQRAANRLQNGFQKLFTPATQ